MWARSSIPEQSKKGQLAVGAVMLGLLGWYLITTEHNAPNKRSVDGIYRSSCCSDIIIKDGNLSYGRNNVAVDLESMKFGLTGYVDGQFTRNGIKRSTDQTAIDFSELRTRHVIYLPVDGRSTSFALGLR